MRALVVIAAGVLAGCALKAPITHTELVDQALPQGTHIPPAWKATPDTERVEDDWLKSFNDPMLDAIVAEAIANNLDLSQAADRVIIAQQNVIVAGAQLLPQVGVQLAAATVRDKDQDSNFNSSHVYASVAWELDIWGRLRAQRAASEAAYEATALDYAFARQSLAALTAKSWYLAIETRQLVGLAEQSVKVFSDLLELTQVRRSAGKDSDLDVVFTRARLETAQSALEEAREAYGEARRALEVLLGRAVNELASAVELSLDRYLVGLASYFEVLQAEEQLYASQQALVQTQVSQLTNIVQLYRALGGGWQHDLPSSAPSARAD